jgi:hypothetical protein
VNEGTQAHERAEDGGTIKEVERGIWAGFGRTDITPRTPVYLAGYAGREHSHTGVQAPIYVRCLWLRDADRHEAVVIQADLLWFRGVSDAVREVVSRSFGVPLDSVFACGTHTHAAPATDRNENEQWRRRLIADCRDAAEKARSNLQPVRMRITRGHSTVNVNRREPNLGGPYNGPERNDNAIRIGKNPAGPVDHGLLLVRFESPHGAALGTLLSYASHGTGLADTNLHVSPDWIGGAVTRLESQGALGTVLFLNGATGDVDPVVAYQQCFEPLLPLVEEFADDVRRAVCRGTDTVELGNATLFVRSKRLCLPAKSAGGQQRCLVSVHCLGIGVVRLLFFPGELFCRTGLAVRKADPRGLSIMVCYANEADAGYIPERAAFAEGGYEVWASKVGEGAEEIVRRGLLELIATSM